jgi:hypothetical protein
MARGDMSVLAVPGLSSGGGLSCLSRLRREYVPTAVGEPTNRVDERVRGGETGLAFPNPRCCGDETAATEFGGELGCSVSTGGLQLPVVSIALAVYNRPCYEEGFLEDWVSLCKNTPSGRDGEMAGCGGRTEAKARQSYS